MVGAIVAQHLATPGQHAVGLVAIDGVAEFPGRQSLERGIELPAELGLFVVLVATHRIHRCRRGRERQGIALLDRHRAFEADREGEPLEVAGLRLRVGLLNGDVDLGRLTVVAALGTAGEEHGLEK